MAPPGSQKVEVFPEHAPIEIATRELNSKTYIVAANKSRNPQSVKLSSALFAAKKASVLFEEHRANILGNDLADSFVPFGVHVYCIE